MKTKIILLVLIAFVTISCNQNKTEKETTTVETTKDTTQLYACPMHPEITGKKGATCLECGMELTEPVATKVNENNK